MFEIHYNAISIAGSVHKLKYPYLLFNFTSKGHPDTHNSLIQIQMYSNIWDILANHAEPVLQSDTQCKFHRTGEWHGWVGIPPSALLVQTYQKLILKYLKKSQKYLKISQNISKYHCKFHRTVEWHGWVEIPPSALLVQKNTVLKLGISQNTPKTSQNISKYLKKISKYLKISVQVSQNQSVTWLSGNPT